MARGPRWLVTQAFLRYQLRGTGVFREERVGLLRLVLRTGLALALGLGLWAAAPALGPSPPRPVVTEAPPAPVRVLVCAPAAPVTLDEGPPIPPIWAGQRC